MKTLGKIIVKILKIIGISVASILALLVIADVLWIYAPQWRASRKIADVANYASNIEEIEVSDEAKIIAIGEATHGNADFQNIKLEVLKQMVEKKGARSFALEVDFGDGILINNYIHGGEGTAKDVIGDLSFVIYQTEEVQKMVQWMRDYNDRVDEEEKLSFYGFDMQVPEHSLQFVKEFCKDNGIAISEDDSKNHDSIDAIKAELVAKEKQLKDQHNYALIVKACDTLAQANEYYSDKSIFDDYQKMNNIRDRFMADNVEWISEYEKSLGNDVIVIGAHNGHVQKMAQFYNSMGSYLANECGNAYFVISTDYYHTVCNINMAGPDNTRGEFRFCSADPMAKQAKYLNGSYYINFSKVNSDSKTYEIINNKMNMGSLGEGYSTVMKIMPSSNRIKEIPTQLSDAMIFVYAAKPFSLLK